MKNLESIEQLIDSFEKLPSIGHRTAERLAYAVIDLPDEDIQELSKNLINVKNKVHTCPNCGMFTDKEICNICSDSDRISDTLIVVSNTKNALSIENTTQKYKYHVLNGDISLLKNITPDKLNIDSLLLRISKENIKEIILATNPTIEGETTAQYIAKVLQEYDVTVSRLATGLPIGGEIEYLDSLTIDRAISGRTKIK